MVLAQWLIKRLLGRGCRHVYRWSFTDDDDHAEFARSADH
jgi:hypothetical protein